KVFSILRTNPHTWIKNAAQGGSSHPYQPTDEEIEIAFAARDSIGGNIVGVDILQDRDGNYSVLEVNAVPGWKQLEAALDLNIAREVITYISSSLKPTAPF
ncbi:MAG: hypothetical protein VX438_00230, partial [Planctomycetota bacterium]|nr:hypothetical protein [Planctomycetota bacterium]